MAHRARAPASAVLHETRPRCSSGACSWTSLRRAQHGQAHDAYACAQTHGKGGGQHRPPPTLTGIRKERFNLVLAILVKHMRMQVRLAARAAAQSA